MKMEEGFARTAMRRKLAEDIGASAGMLEGGAMSRVEVLVSSSGMISDCRCSFFELVQNGRAKVPVNHHDVNFPHNSCCFLILYTASNRRCKLMCRFRATRRVPRAYKEPCILNTRAEIADLH